MRINVSKLPWDKLYSFPAHLKIVWRDGLPGEEPVSIFFRTVASIAVSIWSCSLFSYFSFSESDINSLLFRLLIGIKISSSSVSEDSFSYLLTLSWKKNIWKIYQAYLLFQIVSLHQFPSILHPYYSLFAISYLSFLSWTSFVLQINKIEKNIKIIDTIYISIPVIPILV